MEDTKETTEGTGFCTERVDVGLYGLQNIIFAMANAKLRFHDCMEMKEQISDSVPLLSGRVRHFCDGQYPGAQPECEWFVWMVEGVMSRIMGQPLWHSAANNGHL